VKKFKIIAIQSITFVGVFLIGFSTWLADVSTQAVDVSVVSADIETVFTVTSSSLTPYNQQGFINDYDGYGTYIVNQIGQFNILINVDMTKCGDKIINNKMSVTSYLKFGDALPLTTNNNIFNNKNITSVLVKQSEKNGDEVLSSDIAVLDSKTDLITDCFSENYRCMVPFSCNINTLTTNLYLDLTYYFDFTDKNPFLDNFYNPSGGKLTFNFGALIGA
jgi:hypothetical protein